MLQAFAIQTFESMIHNSLYFLIVKLCVMSTRRVSENIAFRRHKALLHLPGGQDKALSTLEAFINKVSPSVLHGRSFIHFVQYLTFGEDKSMAYPTCEKNSENIP